MVITRTPYRISFFGGGTDYPAWYSKNRGAVLSLAINKYNYISCRVLPPFFPYAHRVVYSKTEMTSNIDKIDHPSVRETMRFLGLDKIGHGFEIHHTGDLPAWSGMGSSASFTVGLLNGLSAITGDMKSKLKLATEAIHIDQKMVGENVGDQDHVAAAFGGINKIEFGEHQRISVTPIHLSEARLNHFKSYLLLFFTNIVREASVVAKGWIDNTPKNEKELNAMLSIVDSGTEILTNKRQNLDEFGKLLHETWKIKRTLAPKITTSKIDEIYKEGLKAGAIGGKLL